MTALPRRKIISSGRKNPNSRYDLATPPEADNISFAPEQVGRRYGWVEITTPERRYTRGWSGLYVQVRCVGCKREGWTYLTSLTRGKSAGCYWCSQPRRAVRWVMKRVTAMKTRCRSTKDPGYANYGGRGIEFRFETTLQAALWVEDNLGLHRDKELDRTDNNGHYEPGNLRYATPTENRRNQRRSKLLISDMEWSMFHSPYSHFTTNKMLRSGFSKEAVIGMAYKAVLDRRKGWKRIQSNLASLGYTT